MKISVSLPASEVEFLDEFAQKQGMASRSAAVAKAIKLLRSASLASQYAQAWEEWDSSEDSELWDSASADGL